MQLQIGTVPFVLELGPSSPHKEYLPSSDNCVEMSGGNVLKTKGNFHMAGDTHKSIVCMCVSLIATHWKCSFYEVVMTFCSNPGRENTTTYKLVVQAHMLEKKTTIATSI